MKRLLSLFAVLAGSALAQEPAPAVAQAPALAPAAEKSAPAPAPAAPSPVVLPRVKTGGPTWESLPPDEREHVRRMKEFRALRDKAERELIELGKRADERKKKILEENEEAKALHDRIEELQTEFASATNALETIYRADEELGRIAERIEPARRIVESNQRFMTQEVVESMKKRLAEQQAVLETNRPVIPRPELTPESTGMDPQAFSNLFVRPRPVRPSGPLPGNPDVKPPSPAGRRPGQPPSAPLNLPSPAPAAK